MEIGADTSFWAISLALAIVVVFFILFVSLWVGWWLSDRIYGVSPYTGLPLRRATDLSFYSAEKVMRYLYEYKQYDNRIFKLSRASFCRDTGRIFQDSVNLLEIIRVDWNFLQKRYPGLYVSWGSLNRDQQQAIKDAHYTLEGFQIYNSSPNPAPRLIEPDYIYTKPGPLYVDLQTKVLIGWKIVPGTDLEVLIVQKPKKPVK